jgi:hypothetical protein
MRRMATLLQAQAQAQQVPVSATDTSEGLEIQVYLKFTALAL